MTEETTAESPAEEWALCEFMGHNAVAGKIQEVQRFGATLLRVDRPLADGTWVTTFHGGSSIYQVTPCSEAIARESASRAYDPRPVAPLTHRLESKPGRDTFDSRHRNDAGLFDEDEG